MQRRKKEKAVNSQGAKVFPRVLRKRPPRLLSYSIFVFFVPEESSMDKKRNLTGARLTANLPVAEKRREKSPRRDEKYMLLTLQWINGITLMQWIRLKAFVCIVLQPISRKTCKISINI